jgi:hypothetical protein
MSEAPGSAVSPNAPQTSSTLSLPPQITPQGNQPPMIAATWHAPGARREHQARPTRPTHTLSEDRTSPASGNTPTPRESFLFTMQLAYDDVVIRTEHLHPGFSAFPVRCLLALLCQAVHRGEMAGSAARVRLLGSMGRKRFMNAIEHCVNR